MAIHIPSPKRLSGVGIVMAMALVTATAAAQTVRTIPLSRAITLDGIFVLADGSLLGASAHNGTSLWHVDTAGVVHELATGLGGPIHAIQDQAGNRYLSNYSDAGTISKVTADGVVSTFAIVPQGPAGLALGPDGLVYVAIYGDPQGSGEAIYRIDPDGHAEVFVSGHGISGPVGIAFDGHGVLYSVNARDGRVFRITPDGAVSAFATLPKGPGFFSAGHLAYAGGPFFASGNSSQVVYLITADGGSCVFAGTGHRGGQDGPVKEAEFAIPTGLRCHRIGAHSLW